MAQAQTSVDILNQQKQRLTVLQDRRVRAQVRLETERKTLEDAKAEALALFGTSDLAELRKLYQSRQEENDQKVVDFMLSLDEVEQGLTDIERQINL